MIEQITNFIIENWVLTSILAGLFIVILFGEISLLNSKNSQISVSDLVQHMNHDQKLVILDTRSPEAFKTGHILKAVSIDPTQFLDSAGFKKYSKKKIIFVSETGQDMESMIKKIKQDPDAPMTELFFLTGGMQAWRTAQYPLVSDLKSKSKSKSKIE